MKNFENILLNELNWLKYLFLLRIQDAYIDVFDDEVVNQIDKNSHIRDRIAKDLLHPPQLLPEISLYSNFIVFNKLSLEERALLILTLATHIAPNLLDEIFHEYMPNGEQFYKCCDLGGIKGEDFRGILPTGLTWLYLVAGRDFQRRNEFLRFLLMENSPIFELKVVNLINENKTEPILNGQLIITEEYLKVFVFNELPEK